MYHVWAKHAVQVFLINSYLWIQNSGVTTSWKAAFELRALELLASHHTTISTSDITGSSAHELFTFFCRVLSIVHH